MTSQTSTRPRGPGRRSLVVGLIVGALLLVVGAGSALALQPPAPSDEFVPVSQLPAKESLPAAPLLIAAYAVVWIMLTGYVTLLWRRLARVEQELGGIERQIAEQRRS